MGKASACVGAARMGAAEIVAAWAGTAAEAVGVMAAKGAVEIIDHSPNSPYRQNIKQACMGLRSWCEKEWLFDRHELDS